MIFQGMIRDYILNEGLSNNYGDSALRNNDLIGTYNLTNKNVLYSRMARKRMGLWRCDGVCTIQPVLYASNGHDEG